MGILTPSTSTVRQTERNSAGTLTSVPQASALITGDLLALTASYLISLPLLSVLGVQGINLHSLLVWGGVWLLWRAYQGLYPGYGRSPQTELRLHVTGTIQLVAVQLAAAFAVQPFAPSVPGVLLYWMLALITSLFTRYAVRSILIRLSRYGRPISIIGAGQTAQLAISHLKTHPSYGLNPVAAYDDNPALHGTDILGVPVLGTLDLALTDPRTEQALISMPGARAELQQRIVNATYAVFPHTWVIPDLFGVPNQALQPHNIGSVASLEVRNNLRSVH